MNSRACPDANSPRRQRNREDPSHRGRESPNASVNQSLRVSLSANRNASRSASPRETASQRGRSHLSPSEASIATCLPSKASAERSKADTTTTARRESVMCSRTAGAAATRTTSEPSTSANNAAAKCKIRADCRRCTAAVSTTARSTTSTIAPETACHSSTAAAAETATTSRERRTAVVIAIGEKSDPKNDQSSGQMRDQTLTRLVRCHTFQFRKIISPFPTETRRQLPGTHRGVQFSALPVRNFEVLRREQLRALPMRESVPRIQLPGRLAMRRRRCG